MKIKTILLAGAALAMSSPAIAGTQAPSDPDAQPQPDSQGSQTIVVTGSAIGIERLDTGYNIDVADREQINDLNPFNVGDLLTMIAPGTWSEPTGGTSSTTVAGFPSTSGAPFYTMMVNGTPLLGASQASYRDTSTLHWLDDTASAASSWPAHCSAARSSPRRNTDSDF